MKRSQNRWLTPSAAHPANYFVPIVKKIRSSVISIIVEEPARSYSIPGLFTATSPANKQFGSGFILHRKGYVLTNQHVVENTHQIKIKSVRHQQPLTASLIWSEPSQDLAILQIRSHDSWKSVTLGSAADCQLGEWVIAMGNPLGLEQSVTVGIISGKNRPLQVGNRIYRNVLQTDAAINPGNSGGPLVNMHGQVIAINTMVAHPSQNIGFAIPIDEIKPHIQHLIP